MNKIQEAVMRLRDVVESGVALSSFRDGWFEFERDLMSDFRVKLNLFDKGGRAWTALSKGEFLFVKPKRQHGTNMPVKWLSDGFFRQFMDLKKASIIDIWDVFYDAFEYDFDNIVDRLTDRDPWFVADDQCSSTPNIGMWDYAGFVDDFWGLFGGGFCDAAMRLIDEFSGGKDAAMERIAKWAETAYKARLVGVDDIFRKDMTKEFESIVWRLDDWLDNVEKEREC